MVRQKTNEALKEMMKRPIPEKRVSVIHLEMVKESRSLYGMGRLSSPAKAAETVRPLCHMADRELMLVMSLNNRMEPQAVEVAAVGGINYCGIDIPILFKHTLLNNGACIMCFHNHPSGDPEPSWEDKCITKRIVEAGKILGIPLKDHIILGKDNFYSFREHGFLDGEMDDCA